MGMDKYAVGWLIVAVLLVLFFSYLRWPYLEMPLDRDEGTYLVIGKQVAGGQLPYSDVYEMKPPGLFYTYAVLAAAGAYDFVGARGYTLVIYGLNGLLLFLLLRRRGWRWGALAAQMAFYALSMDPYVHGYALLPEPLMVLSFLSGLLVLTYARRHLLYAVAGGFLLGWSVWIKQNMLFPLLFLGFWVSYMMWIRHSLSRTRVAYVVLGMLLGPLLTTSWIVLHSGWSDMVYWLWTYPAEVYTRSISWAKGMEYLLMFVKYSAPHTWLWVVLALIGVGVHFFLKRGAWGRATPLLFLIFSFFSVSPGLRFYGHYWTSQNRAFYPSAGCWGVPYLRSAGGVYGAECRTLGAFILWEQSFFGDTGYCRKAPGIWAFGCAGGCYGLRASAVCVSQSSAVYPAHLHHFFE
jgi:hypothetical protein